MRDFLLLLLSITLFTKIHNTLTLLKSQSDIFPQNRKEKRERKTTYNELSTELNKGITEIVQKKKTMCTVVETQKTLKYKI